MKFSCGVILRMLKNIDNKKIFKLALIRKSENDLKVNLKLFRAFFQKDPITYP